MIIGGSFKDSEDVFPSTIAEYNKNFLFGLVRINIYVEDRKSKDRDRNYKHVITLKILWKEFHVILRSSSTGYYNLNGLDITHS
jgi:hypothetical protein